MTAPVASPAPVPTQPPEGRTYVRPLDAVDGFDAHESATGLDVRARKRVDAGDPYMAGHFPVVTLFPAVFFLEGVRQSVGAALERSPALTAHVWPETGAADGWLEIDSVRSLRVVKPMLEGDELHLEISVSAASGEPGAVRADAECHRDDVTGPLVATASVTLASGAAAAAAARAGARAGGTP